MQWLIDIIAQRVIETIGIPPCYVSRGDPSDWDFTDATLTADGSYHELDLSSIVPAGATFIVARFSMSYFTPGSAGMFRKLGHTGGMNVSVRATQSANIVFADDILVEVSEDRKIEYRFSSNPNSIYFSVRGWWL
jgi:hypothetical protein